MPIDLIYDIVVERDDQECGKIIRAPEPVFQLVAGILLKMSTEKPDAAGIANLEGLLDVDHVTQASLFSFALQLFGATICAFEDSDMKLRQKPSDPCILQQLQDDEWVDVFDYAACLMPSLQESIETQETIDKIKSGAVLANSIWQEFEDRYTGTSESFDPDLILTGDDEGRNRAALCKTIGTLVRQYVDACRKVKVETAEGINRGVLAIGIGVGIIALIGAILTAGASIPASLAFLAPYLTVGTLGLAGSVGGLTAAFLSAWVQQVKDTEIAVFDDQSAISDVICIWYTNLKDEEDISQEKFSETLSMDSESANAQALYQAINGLLIQPLAYAAFLKTWKQEINLRKNGPLEGELYCECDAPDLILAQIAGYENAILYEGKEGDYDVYLLTSNFNGFSRAIAVAASPGGYNTFYVMEIDFVSGSFTPSVVYTLVEPDVGYHYYTDEPVPNDVQTNAFVIDHPIEDGDVVIRLKILKHSV